MNQQLVNIFTSDCSHTGTETRMMGLDYSSDAGLFVAGILMLLHQHSTSPFHCVVGSGIWLSKDGMKWNKVPPSKYPSQLNDNDWLSSVRATGDMIIAVGNDNKLFQ